jgi:hypothetical protein
MTSEQYTELIDFLGEKFGKIDQRFDAMDRRFDALGDKLDRLHMDHELRLTALEARCSDA